MYVNILFLYLHKTLIYSSQSHENFVMFTVRHICRCCQIYTDYYVLNLAAEIFFSAQVNILNSLLQLQENDIYEINRIISYNVDYLSYLYKIYGLKIDYGRCAQIRFGSRLVLSNECMLILISDFSLVLKLLKGFFVRKFSIPSQPFKPKRK